jgi:hypothetical protein
VKYDLAQFLRERVLAAADLQAVFDEVEPPFAGYRRTEQALARYIELARTDNGEKLPAITKPIDPGQPYAGVPRLVRSWKKCPSGLAGFVDHGNTATVPRSRYRKHFPAAEHPHLGRGQSMAEDVLNR